MSYTSARRRLFLLSLIALLCLGSIALARNITWIQTAFNAGELSPRLLGRVDFDKYRTGCSELTNFVVLPHGGIQNRPGFRYVAAAKNATKKCRLVPFQFSTTQAYILEFGENYIRFYADGGQVTSGASPVEVTTTYAETELPELRFAQSADVLYITHPSHKPAMLQRTSATSFTLTDVSFDWPPFNSENVSDVTMDASGVTGTISIVFSSSSWGLYNSGLTADHIGTYLAVTHDTGSTPTAETPGFLRIETVTSNTSGTATVIEELPTDAAVTTWAESSFNEIYGYPRCVSFFEDRLVFAGSSGFPQRIWLSKTGDYYNFQTGTDADDAIARSINAEQVNSIVWLKSQKQLHFGTIGGEGYLAASGSDALTPTSVTVKTESHYGSVSSVSPVSVGNETLFLQRPGKDVRRYAYDYVSDSFTGTNLSILAEHMTMDSAITDMAYQQRPYNIVWCIRSDGDLLGMTYMKEHEVVAWHRHTTDGDFESVATIPGDTDDELWAVVKRTINGSTVRYIEKLDPFFVDSVTEDAFFVDSGLTYDSTSTTTISGLSHLIGETVTVVADGAKQPDKVVSAAGTITLSYAASVVHVGLPYVSSMATMNMDIMTQGGMIQGRNGRISKLTLRFYNTFGAQISSDGTTYDTVHFPLVDNVVTLFTGDKEMSFPGRYGLHGKIYVKQDLPLPFTLLALIPQIEYQE